MRENWTYKKLGEVCTSITDGSHNPPKGIEHSEYRMISSQNIFDDDLRINDETVRFLTEEDHYKEDKRTKLSKDVVLLTIVGTIGRACVLAGTEGFLTLQRSVAALKPSEKVDSRFLMHCLIGNRERLNQEAHGIAQRGIYLRQLSELDIPIPPLSEQQSIVAELDKINELISLKKAQLSDLDSLAQSIFYDMFGDPIENEKGWEYLKLQTLIDNNIIIYHLDGNHGGDYPRSEEFVDRGVPYIGANCLNDGSVDFSLAKYLPKEKADKLRKGLAKNGDVLFAHNATVGPVAFLNTKEPLVILSTSLTAFRCNLEKMHPLFLRSYMQSTWFESQYKSAMKQTTRNQIPITKQKNMFFICPPLSLQQDFAKRIELIEQQKAQISSTIKDLETLLASRMQYWFD